MVVIVYLSVPKANIQIFLLSHVKPATLIASDVPHMVIISVQVAIPIPILKALNALLIAHLMANGMTTSKMSVVNVTKLVMSAMVILMLNVTLVMKDGTCLKELLVLKNVKKINMQMKPIMNV